MEEMIQTEYVAMEQSPEHDLVVVPKKVIGAVKFKFFPTLSSSEIDILVY